jgi:hypothetical protein
MRACADVHLQRGDERLLRNVHLAELAHALPRCVYGYWRKL